MQAMMSERCEACGGMLEYRREDRAQGRFCQHCDWSVATTFFSALELDNTSYHVRVRGGDPHNGLHVAAVAKVSGQGFAAVRHLLHDTDPLVFTGKAPEVIKVRDMLRAAGLQWDILPPFPHTN
jgi:hypothetical protein